MKYFNNLKQRYLSIDLKYKLLIFSISYIMLVIFLIYVLYAIRISKIVLDRDIDSAYRDVSMVNESLRTSTILVEEISNKIYNNTGLRKALVVKYDNIGESAEVYIDMIYPLINESIFTQREIIESIEIYIDNESFLTNENNVKELSVEITESEWYKKIVTEGNNGQIIWSYEKNGNDEYNLVLYRKLAEYNGVTSGILKISIRETFFMPKKRTQEYAIYNILQKRDNKNIPKDIVPNFNVGLIDKCLDEIIDENTNKLELTYQGVDYIVLSSSFSSNNSQYIWNTLAAVPVDVMLYDVNRQKTDAILIIMIISIIVGTLIVLYINSFTKRIHDLDEKAKIVAQGNFDVRMFVSGQDEIGRLSLSINKMLSYIDNLVNQVLEDKIRMQEYQIEQNKSEFEVLQNQINPHFLYNTLDAMRYKATLSGNQELGNMMISLSRLLSYSVNQKGNLVSLKQEIDHLNNYLLLVKARYEDAIEYKIDIDEYLYKIAINKLTLQPLVENCVKHAMQTSKKVLNIIVAGEVKDDKVILTISDDGRGMSKEHLELINGSTIDAETPDERAHVGINNVKLRIKMIYGEEYGVKVKSILDVGTQVYITIPNKEHVNDL